MSITLLIVIFLALVSAGRQLLAKPETRSLGYGIFGGALIFFLLAFGYNIGKDLAHRDIAHQSSSSSLGA